MRRLQIVLWCQVAICCVLFARQSLADQLQDHKLTRRQVPIDFSCFSDTSTVDNVTQCAGVLIDFVSTLEECCQPREIGGLGGSGYRRGVSLECSLCPTNVSTDVEIRCHSGESCDQQFTVVPDVASCCLLEGERSFTVERPSGGSGQCQRCVVLEWADAPQVSLPENPFGFMFNVRYSKGESVGFVDGRFRVETRFITADPQDIIITDQNINLGGGDLTVGLTAVIDDIALELSDLVQLVLQPLGRLAANEIVLDTLNVVIEDNEQVEVLLTETDYEVRPEDSGSLQITVDVRTDIATPFFVRVIPMTFGLARNEMSADNLELANDIVRNEVNQQDDQNRPSEANLADFNSTPIIVEIDASGDHTVGIPVTPDDIYEPDQTFLVLLELVNETFADRILVQPDRAAAIGRIVDDDFITLTWEEPAYTYFETLNVQFAPSEGVEVPRISKQDNMLTEYRLSIYAEPAERANLSLFVAEQSTFEDPIINNDFGLVNGRPGLVQFIQSTEQSVIFNLQIFPDNVFNEGVEAVSLVFQGNDERSPEFQFGVYPVTQLIIFDRNLTVGFAREVTVVSEGVGSFELCVTIFMPEMSDPTLPLELANPFTLQLLSENGTADLSDYIQITGADELLVPFETDNSTHIQCFNVTVLDDLEFEREENFSLTLALEGSQFQSVIVDPSLSIVQIVDNDAVTVGFEETEYTVQETEGEVTLTVSVLEGNTSTPVTVSFTTVNGTAFGGMDFEPIQITLTFNVTTPTINITVPIIADSAVEGDEQFTARLVLIGPLEFSDRITVQPDIVTIHILDASVAENVTRVNDTVIGDPLFTVPLRVTNLEPLGLEQDLSLCYEVHGEADRYFNLVSDVCTSVNAHYTNISVFNIIDSIAVRAVDEGGRCREVLVRVEDACSASVDGVTVEGLYSEGGVTVRRYPGRRVRVSVPNCAHINLVMWVYCQNSTLRAYDTDDQPILATTQMIKFVITRGFNLQERSHGLIGQFWNIPIEIQLFNETLENSSPGETFYTVTVAHPDSPTRTFIAFYYPRTWEVVRGQNDPCLYAGSDQADTAHDQDTHSVIQGVYRDYIVGGAFETEYQYSRFETERCS